MEFLTENDCRMRLRNTVVRDRAGRPLHVLDALSATRVQALCMVTREESRYNVKDLNLEPVRLGYVNYRRGCVFVSRKPRRQWKQGLSKDCLTVLGNMEVVGPRILSSSELGRCILRDYPSLEQAYQMVDSQMSESQAFSPNFAINNWDLMHKNEPVGYFEDGQPVLEPEFEYLQGKLDEELRNAD